MRVFDAAGDLLFLVEEVVFGLHEGREVATLRGRAEVWAVSPVAHHILECLAEPLSAGDLVVRVAERFNMVSATDKEQVTAYVSMLVDQRWVEVVACVAPDTAGCQRYLYLLKRALVNLLYPEHELRMRYLASAPAAVDYKERERMLRDIRQLQPEAYAALVQCKQMGGVLYGEPTRDAHTMIGLRRLNNLEYCARRIFADGIPGDFLEAGVCQGGAAIFLRALQVALGEESRSTWVADSFQGLPPPVLPEDSGLDLTEARFPWLAMGEETVRNHFCRYGLLDDHVKFLPGWFSDTLRDSETGSLAILRIDADLYESTRDVLQALYERVPVGGFIIIDDYNVFAPCRQAVDEFRQQQGIDTPLLCIDWTGVFWRKE